VGSKVRSSSYHHRKQAKLKEKTSNLQGRMRKGISLACHHTCTTATIGSDETMCTRLDIRQSRVRKPPKGGLPIRENNKRERSRGGKNTI